METEYSFVIRYRFVNVEKDGFVSAFAPRLSSGEHHVLLIIQSGESRRVHIPISPLKVGMVEVKIEALSGANRDQYIETIEVKYEGVTNIYHTPYLLQLVNQPRMMSEFEIVTNQTFILPLQQMWSYVPGSATAKVAITGDVSGPYFYLGYDMFKTTEEYFGISLAPVEAGIFSYGTMIYNLIYMRQGHGGKNFLSDNVLKIIDWINYEYQRIMICYDENGFFTQYCLPDTESVWLTAWTIAVLKDGVDPMWERQGLYIDPELLNNTVVWLISKQDPVNGSWSELSPVYDRKFLSNFTFDRDGKLIQLNLSLTAQCLIALKLNADVRGINKMILSIIL